MSWVVEDDDDCTVTDMRNTQLNELGCGDICSNLLNLNRLREILLPLRFTSEHRVVYLLTLS